MEIPQHILDYFETSLLGKKIEYREDEEWEHYKMPNGEIRVVRKLPFQENENR